MITQITDNGTGDYRPDISGSNVVWWSTDEEIYMTTSSHPVPSISFGGLALLAGLVLSTARWLTQRRRVASA